MVIVKRSAENPILKPNKEQSWESEAVFNGCPVKRGNNIHLLYRALSPYHYHSGADTQMQVSDIGIAVSRDGLHFRDRKRFIVPEYSWERYGCEDPRVTKLDDTYYIFYTALGQYPFTPDGIRVGVALSPDLKRVTAKHLVTPFNAKAMALFPERINGKMYAILTAHTDTPPSKIALASFNSETDLWSKAYWEKWHKEIDSHAIHLQRRSDDHVEVGAPPIKTKYGWLLVYSYIRNYYSPQHLFTIEAVLLDLKNPSKVIGRTTAPLLTPEEEYERYGLIPNIVFPSGTLLHNDTLHIYYGAADATCCVATVSLSHLLKDMMRIEAPLVRFERALDNPILTPQNDRPWKARAVFNPAAFYEGNKVHLVYRAMSPDNTSVLGYATSRDGTHFDEQFSEPIYVPREPFEQKLAENGYSGCEDPRITKIGTTLYMCYTAYDSQHPPRIALTSIPLKKFLKREWDWAKPIPLSPPDFDNKDACIFPEKVKGKYIIFHRMGVDVDIAVVPSLKFDGTTWLEEQRWLYPRKGMWDSRKVGIAAPPVKTKKGWILIYHGVSDDDGMYRVGALLLDLKDPTKIIGRTDHPLLEPDMPYEQSGEVANVVFPCGNVIIKDRLFIYYGGGDKVVGVASIKVSKLLEVLQ